MTSSYGPTIPPRALTQRDRPTTDAIVKALADVVALYEQGLMQPKVSLSQSGMTHVGQTIANARDVLAKTRREPGA